MTRLALVLDGAVDAALVGGKGAALGRLIERGVPVPPTGIVTTDTYRAVVDGSPAGRLVDRIRAGAVVDGAEVDAVFSTLELPDEVARAVADTVARVGGDGRLAIRSSATAEDLATSSFAGQYRSLLDVDATDPSAVADALRLVFASLWHPAPCAYRRAFAIADDDVAMAAVVMRMVPATRAGVVFTVDPAGDGDRMRVEAVHGLGEALVSGAATPDVWLLPRDGSAGPADQPGEREDAPVPSEIAEAGRLARRIEDDEGTPQDVEWAFDGSRVWVVQARPITVTGAVEGDGFDDAPDDVELTTAGIGEMLPGVFPPWRWWVASLLVNEAFARIVTDLGAELPRRAADRGLVRRVRGRAAMDLDALRELARDLPGGSADDLEAQYFGARAGAGPPTDDAAPWWASIGHDLRSLALRRRASLDAEIVIAAVAALDDTAVDDSAFDDSAFDDSAFDDQTIDHQTIDRRMARLVDLAIRGTAAELAVAAAATTSFRKIELILTPHLGSAEAARWTERVTSGRGLAVATTPDACAAVFGGPTWRELGRRPPTGSQLGAHRRSDRSEHEEALHSLLRSTRSWGHGGLRSALRTRALRQLTAEATVLLHRREATRAALAELGGRVRRLLLEQGRRLTAAGVLADATDVELLTPAEVRAALAGRPPAPHTIAERARWRARYESAPPLPARFTGAPVGEPVSLAAGDRFDAWAVSPGRATAKAVAVADADAEVAPGSVLVAVSTDASWSPLFLEAAGIVVERGGPLSHAAILARELGVPAVVNLPGACHALDGRTVTVDGDAGIVVVHDDDGGDAP